MVVGQVVQRPVTAVLDGRRQIRAQAAGKRVEVLAEVRQVGVLEV